MTEEFVKNAIIRYLSRNEWGTNLQFGTLREKGVDIKVRHNRYARYFLIECKGQGIGRGSSEVAFVYSLGQIISRMKTGGTTRYYYALGLPEKSAKIALRRLPWQVANKNQDNYYLILVSNLSDAPEFKLVQNPSGKLKAKKNIYTTVQLNWSVTDKDLKGSIDTL